MVSKDAPMPVHGDAVTFNLNIVLRDSIVHSQYFRELLNKRSFQEVAAAHQMMEEVVTTVKHVEPWVQPGSSLPSTMFCCLYRLLLMRLSGSLV